MVKDPKRRAAAHRTFRRNDGGVTIITAMAGKTKGNPRSSGYQRSERDLYTEPEWAVEALLDAEKIEGPIWDPACGTGTIPRVCRRRGLVACGTDIADKPRSLRHDFLMDAPMATTRDMPIQSIICNPPFKLAEEFIRHAVVDLKVDVAAFLLRLAFLEGQARRKMFERTPLARVLVFSKRVSMPPPGTKQVGGAVAFAWFVWRRGHVGPPTIGWLP